jgi:division protein CdvB (Snf7/Vps24/ESCRT-III family)
MPKVDIPISALQIADEDGTLIVPAVGDVVSFTVEGAVESIGDEYAVIGMDTVNGEPAYTEDVEEEAAVETPAREDLVAAMEEVDLAGGL